MKPTGLGKFHLKEELHNYVFFEKKKELMLDV